MIDYNSSHVFDARGLFVFGNFEIYKAKLYDVNSVLDKKLFGTRVAFLNEKK